MYLSMERVSKEAALAFVGNRKDSDDDPEVQGAEVKLSCVVPRKKCRSFCIKSSKYFCRTFAAAFVAVAASHAIPKQRAHLPIEHL